jgi:hypothetical protein
MTRLIAICILFFVGVTVHAQSFLGVTAGANFATIQGDDVKSGVSVSTHLSARAAITAQMKAWGPFYVETGIGYTGKGYRAKSDQYQANVSMDYLEWPLLAVAKIPVDKKENFKLMVGAGIYGAIGVQANFKVTSDDPNYLGNGVYDNGSFDDYGLNKGDFGYRFMTGIELKEQYQLSFHYEIGHSVVFYGDDFGFVRNRNMGIMLTYSW